MPLGVSIAREIKSAPCQQTSTALKLEHRYTKRCASCHGKPCHNVAFAEWMFPRAPQLWKKARERVVGVSDDEVERDVLEVENGIRVSECRHTQNFRIPKCGISLGCSRTQTSVSRLKYKPRSLRPGRAGPSWPPSSHSNPSTKPPHAVTRSKHAVEHGVLSVTREQVTIGSRR